MKRTNLSRSGHVPSISNAVADILNFTYTLHFSRDGGLVCDSSIIKCNACAALVSQYRPIKIISNSGLITRITSTFDMRPFQTTPER